MRSIFGPDVFGSDPLPVLVFALGVLGLLIGSFLNVVVWRVPRGESLLPDSHCPHCDAPIRPWQNIPVLSWLLLRGRCASCSAPISVRYPLVELGTAVAFAMVTWWWGAVAGAASGYELGVLAWWLTLAALLWFAAACISLTLIDIEHQRLPDAIVLPSLVVVMALLAGAALLEAEWATLATILGSSAASFLLYVLIALVYPAGLGGGDVKLAPLIGGVLGLAGIGAVVVGVFAGFVFGAVYGLALMTLGRATRKSGIPFGPFMLAGAWFGLLLGEPTVAWYLGLVGLG